MRVAYRVLAYLIALAVAVQAAAIALALFGLMAWVEGGGTLNMAAVESGQSLFAGEGGFAVHGTAGMMIIPILGLLLLICSFFVKSRRAIALAGITLGCIVIQVLLGMFGHSLYWIGAVHGLFAFALLAAAVIAATGVARLGGPGDDSAATDVPPTRAAVP